MLFDPFSKVFPGKDDFVVNRIGKDLRGVGRLMKRRVKQIVAKRKRKGIRRFFSIRWKRRS